MRRAVHDVVRVLYHKSTGVRDCITDCENSKKQNITVHFMRLHLRTARTFNNASADTGSPSSLNVHEQSSPSLPLSSLNFFSFYQHAQFYQTFHPSATISQRSDRKKTSSECRNDGASHLRSPTAPAQTCTAHRPSRLTNT